MELLQPLAIRTYPGHNLDTSTPYTTSAATTPRTLTPTPQAASLLSLPTELRLQIYSYLLLSDRHKTPNSLLPPGPLLHPSILATCRLIHFEGTPVLYAHNVFTAHPTLLVAVPHHVSPLHSVLASRCVRQIRHWRVIVRLDCDARFTVEAARAAFSDVETLLVEVEQTMYRGAGFGVLMTLEGVRRVRSARVVGSVTPNVARWLEKLMMGNDAWDGVGEGNTEVSNYEPWADSER